MNTLSTIENMLETRLESGCFSLVSENCAEKGALLHDSYCHAEPYPHVVIPSMLSCDVVRHIVAEFPQHEQGQFFDPRSKLKTGYNLDRIKSAYIHSVINALNSAAFLEFLKALTGIKGLIPDPYQTGGGLHETCRGGHLSIHADFNMHPMLKLKRRLNLIMFLNENWHESFGGQLELWSRDMKQCCKKVQPELGTVVIFNTDADAFHGHPEPLACPETLTRRSLALYYYTAFAKDASSEVPRSTNFKVRPGSSDRLDYRTHLRELARDICPPMLYRALSREAGH